MQHLDEGRLQEWLDRDRSGMSDGEQEAVARHLAECAACADRVEALAELTHRTRSLLATARPDERAPVTTRGPSATEANAPPVPAHAPSVPEPNAPPFTSVRARARTVEAGRRRHRRWRTGAWAASVVLAVAAGWSANELTRGAPSATLLSPDRFREAALPRNAMPPRAEEALAEGRDASRDAGAESPREAGPVGGSADTPVPAPPPPAGAAASPPAVMAERPESRTGDANAASDPAPSVTADAGPPAASSPSAATPDRPTATAPPSASAGQPADAAVRPTVVAGRVTDAAGAPIEAAQVYVPDTGIGALTRADGTFLLLLGGAAPAPGGSLTVTVERIGYGAETRAVVADGGTTLSADFELAQQALSLDEIVVTGTAGTTRRRSLGNSVSTLTAAPAGEPATIGSPMWTRVEPDAVAAELGFAPRSLPERPVDQVAVATLPDGTTVARTLQTLEDGTPITLYESLDPIRLDPESVEEGHRIATSARGDRMLIATGPLTVEALGALLARIR